MQSVSYVGGNNDKLKAEYQYDHTGTLIARKVSKANGPDVEPTVQVWERYLVDNQNLTGYSQVLATFNVDPETGENKLKRLNLISDQIVAQDDYAGEKPYVQYLHGDALGSVRTVNRKRDAGALDVTPLNYTAFGETQEAQSATTTRPTTTRPTEYAFTGQMKDTLTSMQYHRARWYENGHWTSGDALLDFPRNVGNQFMYVGNNPILFSDSSGQFTSTELMTDVAIIALAASFIFSMSFLLSRAIALNHYQNVFTESIAEYLDGRYVLLASARDFLKKHPGPNSKYNNEWGQVLRDVPVAFLELGGKAGLTSYDGGLKAIAIDRNLELPFKYVIPLIGKNQSTYTKPERSIIRDAYHDALFITLTYYHEAFHATALGELSSKDEHRFIYPIQLKYLSQLESDKKTFKDLQTSFGLPALSDDAHIDADFEDILKKVREEIEDAEKTALP